MTISNLLKVGSIGAFALAFVVGPSRETGRICKNTLRGTAEYVERCQGYGGALLTAIGLVALGLALFWLARKLKGRAERTRDPLNKER